MSSSIHITIMPSKSSLKKQVDSTHKALKNFNAVKSFKSLVIVRAAIIKLIDITIAFNQYTPFFLKEAAFQELPTAVCTFLDDFSSKNPSFVLPLFYPKIATLEACVKEYVLNKKKGMFLILSFLFGLIGLFPESVPSTPHADRTCKACITIHSSVYISSASNSFFFTDPQVSLALQRAC